MFAYCLNSPVFRLDSSGCTSVIPVPTLKDYYFMHKAVQYDIAEQYGFGIEVFVVGSKGIGRLDLYDGTTNQYYEVKHKGADQGKLFEDQMRKYDASHVSGWRFDEYSFTENVTKGTKIIHGKTQYSYWDIFYLSHGDGVITYTYVLNEQRYAPYAACVTAVAAFAIVSHFAGGGSIKRPEEVALSSVC